MKFFIFVLFVWMVTGGNGVYARGVASAEQMLSKSRAVSAQFYREVQRLRQNLGEAERVLYANHRIDEKLLHLLLQEAKQSPLTEDTSAIADILIGSEITKLEDGEEITIIKRDPQQLLEMIAGKEFIEALQTVDHANQRQWKHLEQNESYIIDFSVFIQRNPVYAFMLNDEHATVLKRNAASRILTTFGIEPSWEALPLDEFVVDKASRDTFSDAVFRAKYASAEFYQALVGLTQEFLNTERELYREYDVTRKVSEYLLQKSINGEFYGGTISKIARDNVKAHDLLSAAVSPDYNAELEVLNTEYLEKAAALPLFKEHAEHTKLWDVSYAEMLSERHIAFKLKGHVVDNLIKELIGTAVYDKDSDYMTIQP